jgi:hypothetical protein
MVLSEISVGIDMKTAAAKAASLRRWEMQPHWRKVKPARSTNLRLN